MTERRFVVLIVAAVLILSLIGILIANAIINSKSTVNDNPNPSYVVNEPSKESGETNTEDMDPQVRENATNAVKEVLKDSDRDLTDEEIDEIASQYITDEELQVIHDIFDDSDEVTFTKLEEAGWGYAGTVDGQMIFIDDDLNTLLVEERSDGSLVIVDDTEYGENSDYTMSDPLVLEEGPTDAQDFELPTGYPSDWTDEMIKSYEENNK
ncbi:MAG: hypothetical protein IJ593_06695 [Lachnospiraceae bacterium]|nr:hypothetical protein [Lachnospiraceae bacterium]